ncbi:MAG: fluoride efflux transporter CrcB [Phycisphaeraceae bacterium]|nr:fluoride efflux transporter CrcB [Phycisphaeraceae bacterium]
MALRLLLIFVGGGLGSMLRYLIGGWTQHLAGITFPLGTLTVNVIGCITIGFLATLFTGPYLVREEVRLALLIGVLGGFTTFSSFSWETLALAQGGQWTLAGLNVLLSNGLGLVGVWAGAKFSLVLFGS